MRSPSRAAQPAHLVGVGGVQMLQQFRLVPRERIGARSCAKSSGSTQPVPHRSSTEISPTSSRTSIQERVLARRLLQHRAHRVPLGEQFPVAVAVLVAHGGEPAGDPGAAADALGTATGATSVISITQVRSSSWA